MASGIEILECIIVTPEATVLKSPTQFVAVPFYDGELGIAAGRADMIGRLGFGELRLREGDRTLRYYIEGDFVQVTENILTVLTNRAIPAEKIGAVAAEKQLSDVQKRKAESDELLAMRDRAVAAARGQLRVARRSQGLT